MELKSSAFEHGKAIPTSHTCEGEDMSPPLAWSGLPDGTRSLVLIVEDPDAPDPDAPKMTWIHWVVFNLPPESGGLEAGASRGSLPRGARQGSNSWGDIGYGGPCPPIGEHRYFHRLFALDTTLELNAPSRKRLLRAMQGHVLDTVELVGLYSKAD